MSGATKVKFSIGAKVTVVLAVILSFISLVAYLGLVPQAERINLYGAIADKNMPVKVLIERVVSACHQCSSAIRTYLIDETPSAARGIPAALSGLRDLLGDLDSASLPESRSYMTDLNGTVTTFAGYVESAANAASMSRPEDVRSALRTEGSLLSGVQRAADAYGDFVSKLSAEWMAGAKAARAETLRNVYVGMGLEVLIAIGAALVLHLSVTLPVRKLTKAAEAGASGDLTRDVTVTKSGDEVQVFSESFRTMVENTRALIAQVTKSSGQVAGTAEELSAGSTESTRISQQIATVMEQIAAGSEEQSKSASGSADAVNRLAATIEQVSAGATEQRSNVNAALNIASLQEESLDAALAALEKTAAGTARDAETAAAGSKAVQDVISSMARIESATGETSKNIEALQESSQEVGKVTDVINDIAAQTNLLALNAAIEAARAGEHGRGFAVVADEVRKLAERSAAETRNIGDLMSGVKVAIKKAVSSMEASVTEIKSGMGLARGAGESLDRIYDGTKDTGKLTEELSSSVRTLRKATEDLGKALKDVARVTDENAGASQSMNRNAQEVTGLIRSVAAASEESAAAAEEVAASADEMSTGVQAVAKSAVSLAEMAQTLADQVSKFRVN